MSSCSRTGQPRCLSRWLPAEEAVALVFGRAREPWIREYGGVLFVDCGSVGRPKDGDPRAG